MNRPFAILLAAGVMAGCGGTEAPLLRRQFAQMYSCPADRDVTVTRWDLYHMLKPAPPEVQASPERAQAWRDSNNPKHQYFDVRGCGHEVVWECHREAEPSGPSNEDNEDTAIAFSSCVPMRSWSSVP